MSDTIALPLTPAQLATVTAALMLYRQAGGYPALAPDLRSVAGGTGKALGAASLDALVSHTVRAAAAAIPAQDTPAPPSIAAPVLRHITMEDLGPQAQAAACHAIAIGADRVTFNSLGGADYWRGDQRIGEANLTGDPISEGEVEVLLPRLPGQTLGETYQDAEDRRSADLLRPRDA